MSDTSKKQNFLHGAALLAIATAVVKLIGAFYKIPLKMIIGDQGYGYFTTAYDIYSVLLMISTAGLPIAMSRMISQSSSLGRYNEVRQVYKTSRAIFLGLGVVSTALMLVGCRWLANLLEQPDAWAAIACLAPCALLMCIMSAYRGFFQGQENMRPTSNSQMIEAVFKLIVGLGAAFAIMTLTSDIALAAGGAILGVTVSCLVSVFYLRAKFLPDYQELAQSQEKPQTFGATTKSLLAIAVPITIGSAGLQLLTVVETGVYMDRLVSLLDGNQFTQPLIGLLETEILAANPNLPAGDLSNKVAANLKGIYNFAQTIFNMPCAFIIPITISALPAITSHLALKNDHAVRSTEESAARITGLLSLPCAVGLAILAGPVMGLLGGYTGLKLELARQIMAFLGASVFFYAIIQYTNAVLQSHNLAHVPVINMLLCGVAKLVIVYILVGNPAIGILGAPMGTLACYLGIALLNLFAISRLIPQKPKLLKNLLRPLPAAALMGAAVYGCYHGLILLLGADSSRIILCGVPVCVGVVVYFVCAALFKSITREDCLLLPKGEKIAKLLHL